MESFLSRKRRRLSPVSDGFIMRPESVTATAERRHNYDGEEDTDFKLVLLHSIHPDIDQEHLLEVLLACDGSVENASARLADSSSTVVDKPAPNPTLRQQSSLSSFIKPPAVDPVTGEAVSRKTRRPLTRKNQTLFLFSPEDVELHTPCSIIHNFLPPDEANDLLAELLEDAPSYQTITFKLFDNVVESPHTSAFYVDDSKEAETQRTSYRYNGALIDDVRILRPRMRDVKSKVQEAVNKEIQRRIKEFYPDGKKLQYQDPGEWLPNAAFVNCYEGAAQNVGYHSDQLTYLGPRAVIGSLSLGVARDFRVRRIVARDTAETTMDKNINKTLSKAEQDKLRADAEGQIAIHLPHNSLLVMHAEMQEEWKHSIHPATAITPHPLAGNRRINITYRYYKEQFNPKYTPTCKCGIPCVLRVVQRKAENRGKYFWMCHAGNVPEKDGCDYFLWAVFDDDGNPIRGRSGLDEKKG